MQKQQQKLSRELKNIPTSASLACSSISSGLNKCKDCNGLLVLEINWYLSCIRGKKGNIYLCKDCIKKRRILWGQEHKDKEAINRKNISRRLKMEVIQKYGGKCSCCKESNINYLTIDHISGNGNRHRKEITKGKKLYRWLKHNNFPSGFQVLCYNCNLGKNRYDICPHNKEEFEKSRLATSKINNNNNNSARKSVFNLRLKVINGYGGRCEKCGEINPYFLTIDHIFNDGNIERKQINHQTLWRKLVNLNYPKNKYQLLCFNCNCSKRFIDE